MVCKKQTFFELNSNLIFEFSFHSGTIYQVAGKNEQGEVKGNITIYRFRRKTFHFQIDCLFVVIFHRSNYFDCTRS